MRICVSVSVRECVGACQTMRVCGSVCKVCECMSVSVCLGEGPSARTGCGGAEAVGECAGGGTDRAGPVAHSKARILQMCHHRPRAAPPGWKNLVLTWAVTCQHQLSVHVTSTGVAGTWG